MTLHVDDVAERTLARVVGDLASARRNAGLTQDELSSGLPVRGRAVSEWETGAFEPTLEHLVQWSRQLGRGLVIVGPDGNLQHGPSSPRAGESRETFERRRLAFPLRTRRAVVDLTQGELARFVGVSRDSISRWERARVPPRPIALIVWAQRLECSVALRPIDTPEGMASATTRGSFPA
jgi:transcriptional regulator with XRE-family HTH domain